MDTKYFQIERHNHIITIIFNHPPSNVLTRSVLSELVDIVSGLETDRECKVIIFTSTGQHFCLGADIRELQHLQTAQEGKDFAVRGQTLFNRIEDLGIPVIAAIQGTCLGGGLELAMACHIRLAAKDASFGLPEVKLGLIPGFGGSQRLPRLIGVSKATELILTGTVLTADKALEAGLISEVQPASDLRARAHTLAEAISEKGGLALRAALRAIRSVNTIGSKVDFLREAVLFGELCETNDAKEGLQAFFEKRPPRFTGQ